MLTDSLWWKSSSVVKLPQLLLHVSCEHLQGVWPRRSQPKCSSSSCDDRGSEDARKNVDEADISKADLQEELDVFLKVCLGLQEAENWARVVVVRGLDGVGEESREVKMQEVGRQMFQLK